MRKRSLTAQAGALTAVSAVSKGLGFMRASVLAAVFGATSGTDAFYMAQSIVTLLSSAVGAGLAHAVVPVQADKMNKDGAASADRYASALLLLSALIAAVLGVAIFAFAGPLVALIAPSFTEEHHTLTVSITRSIAVLLMVNTVVMVLSGVLNGRGRYLPAQLIGLPLSIAGIAFAVLGRQALGESALVGGLLIGTALQLAVLAISARRIFRFVTLPDIKSPAVLQTLRLSAPVLVGVVMEVAAQALEKALASGLGSGSVSAIAYSTQLTNLLLGVFILPVTTMLLTSLSDSAAAGALGRVKDVLGRSGRLMLLALLPVAVFCAMYAREIVLIVYQRGSFDENAAALTRTYFLFVSLGLPFMGLRVALTQGSIAIKDTITPLFATLAGVAANVAIDLTLSRRFGIAALGMGYAGFFLFASAFLLLALRRKLGALGLASWAKDFLRSAAGCTAAVLICTLTVDALPLPVFLRLCAAGAIGATTYILTLWVLRQPDVRAFASRCRSWLDNKRNGVTR